jgi:hypothetical protein
MLVRTMSMFRYVISARILITQGGDQNAAPGVVLGKEALAHCPYIMRKSGLATNLLAGSS